MDLAHELDFGSRPARRNKALILERIMLVSPSSQYSQTQKTEILKKTRLSLKKQNNNTSANTPTAVINSPLPKARREAL